MAVVKTGGREAVTHYRVVDRFGAFSMLDCRLETGRTHQVRVHCADLRCPVVGDDLYGRGKRVPLLPWKGNSEVFPLDRFLLHAYRLAFVHPATGEKLEFTVDDPPLFSEFRDAVRAAAKEEGP